MEYFLTNKPPGECMNIKKLLIENKTNFIIKILVATVIITLVSFIALKSTHTIFSSEMNREIEPEYYSKIYETIKNRPELIQVLPNFTQTESRYPLISVFVDIDALKDSCVININNYNKFREIVNSKDLDTQLKKLSHKYDINYVKKICERKIFNEKNISEIND